MSELVIGIIFFEKVDQTIACIRSVLNSEYPIVILNNNSAKKSLEKLESFICKHNQIRLINSKENLGPARGRNLIINNTVEPWFLFLDNDITIETTNWVEKFKNHISNSNNQYEVLIPSLYNVHENQWQHYHSFIYENGFVSACIVQSDYVNCFPGGASFVRRSVFERLGIYDENLDVLEDFEFSIRGLLSNNPLKCLLLKDIQLFHAHRKATNSIDRNAAQVRYSSIKHRRAEKRIIEKHNIYFNSGWSEWTSNQLKIIIGENELKKNLIINKFNSFISKIISAIKFIFI